MLKKYIYAGILLGAVVLTACSQNEGKGEQLKKNVGISTNGQTKVVESLSDTDQGEGFEIIEKVSAATLELTQEQKEAYYKQYVEIVERAMQKKIGISIAVTPMEQFQLEDWTEPKAYEAMVQSMVDEHLTMEREQLNALSSTPQKVVTNINGGTTKTAHIYISDAMRQLEVTGNFETQYSADNDRQLFAKLDNISSQAVSSIGSWEQTSYEASLIDGGRTYSIRIEGIYSGVGVSFEKAFTIEFSCNEFGKIY